MASGRAEPLLGRESAAWHVHREAVLLLGGPRALLLQLAHPLVAQGVADHSRFLEEPLGRLRATLDAMLGIVFGDRETAEAIAARIRSTHAGVVGSLADATRRLPAGSPYRATDPELLLWVHATLVDSTLVVYRRLVGPVSAALRDAYCAESDRIGVLMGIPTTLLPEGGDAFDAYRDEMLAGPVLEVTPTARRLARAVLHPPRLPLPPPLAAFSTALTVELLPTSVAERYGLRSGPRARRLARGFLRAVASVLPRLPRAVRDVPQARRAFRRWGPPREWNVVAE